MRILFVALSAFITLGASAAQLGDFYVIPIAAHVTGANGTSWRTDVSIQNITDVPLTVEFAIVESGEGVADNTFPVAVANDGGSTLTIPAGGSVMLKDILENHRGHAETSGALIVGGDNTFAITSRTYNATADGTFGQTVAAATDIATNGSSALFIPGLVQNGAFRTNLGLFMAAGSDPMTVTVTIRGADGSTLGTRTFNVASNVTTHVQFGSPTVAAAPFDTGSAVIQITGGSGTAVAYASVVDDATGDGSFIGGGTAASGAIQPLRRLFARR